MPTYLAINTVPLARDYGFIVDAYEESTIRNQIMVPNIMRGMRKHFAFMKINKPLFDCLLDFGGFVFDISGKIKHRQAFINLEAVGLSADSLIKAKDVRMEMFLPTDKSKEILLTASDITQAF